MAKSDVEFTFDAKGFQDAINHMSGQMEKMNKGMDTGTKKMSGNVAMGIGKFAMIAGAIVGAFKVASSAIQKFVPEIGTTFGIVGKIIGKNLLWPLRQELIPILQKLLNWVAQNRTLFVQFGMVLVNVFKFVKTTFEVLARLFDPIIQRVRNLLKTIFGDTASSITETINIVIFKLTTLMIALESILAPLFEGIGDLLGGVIVAVQNFGKGFIEGFSSVFSPLEELSDYVGTLGTLLTEIGKTLEWLAPLFKTLGNIIGFGVATSLKIMISHAKAAMMVLTGLMQVLRNPDEAADIVKNTFKNIGSMYADAGKDIFKGAKETGSDIKGNFTGEKVDDAIITKDGKVIKTNPEDNIFATKGGMGGKSIEINIYGPGVLQVTEGNAKQAGSNFAEGVSSKIRDELKTQMVLEGVN